MSETPLAYRALARVADLALPLAGSLSPKLATGDRERRAALARWRAWAAEHRNPARPLLWIHAPSVGEGLQAQAILAILRPRHPEWQIVATFFSPSAEPLAGRQPADHVDYIPYDTPANVDAMLTALTPTAIVFTKADLWPELATRARTRGIAVGMVAGTVSPVSRRRRPIARWLARAGYASLDRVGAIADQDAQGLRVLGTRADRITVTGDPRFDSALTRAARFPADWPPRRLTADGRALVAGSTWPPDEAVLLEAFAVVRAHRTDARLVLVPHEPDPDHVAELLEVLAQSDTPAAAYSALPGHAAIPPVVVVDRVGLLAGLYHDAVAAFVGGGFGTAGLHSVLEPAACRVPVAFGPRWQSSREAGLLLAAGAARALDEVSATDAAAELAQWWLGMLQDPRARDTAGKRAHAVLEGETGGAQRNAAVIERLMLPGLG
ncbi:MAG: 3-deoxy-D-manno-octulosonic acid transferase [Gemmatimonadales bacterium]